MSGIRFWRPGPGRVPRAGVLLLALMAPAARAELFLPFAPLALPGLDREAAAVGDVNGDGRADLLVTSHEGTRQLNVLLQAADGRLLGPTSYPLGPVSVPAEGASSVAVGDLNQDGRLDVVANTTSSPVSQTDGIAVFLQDAAGRLRAGVPYRPTLTARRLAVADLNHDGRADVVSLGSGFVDVHLQGPGGVLAPPVAYPAAHGDDLAVGDVNGDGWADVVVTAADVGVLRQNAGGTLDPVVHYAIAGKDPLAPVNGVAVGDVTGDGREDVVVSYGANAPAARVAVFAQDGAGALEASVSYPSVDAPGPVEVADVDQDGRRDVVVAHAGFATLIVRRQAADGTLGAAVPHPVPYSGLYNPHGLAVADLNADGRADAVLVGAPELALLYRSAPVDSAEFFPLDPGDQWQYRWLEGGGATLTRTVLPGLVDVLGVPTRVVELSSGARDHYTVDDGIRLHRQFWPAAATPLGVDLTVTYQPPVQFVAAAANLGQVSTGASVVTFEIPGVGTFPCCVTYTVSAEVRRQASISVPLGEFETVEMHAVLTLAGTLGGLPVDQRETDTYWLARYVGPVKQLQALDAEVVTLELTALTIDPDGDGVSVLEDNCRDRYNPLQTDSDGDGPGDACDNCTLLANPDQRDTDADGYGNRCDADFNNSGLVTAADYLILRAKLSSNDALTDLNGDGRVTAADYLILRAGLNQPPGPSGLSP